MEAANGQPLLQGIFPLRVLTGNMRKSGGILKNLTDTHKKIVVTNNHDVHLFRLPPKCIKVVILGCESSEDLKDKIFAIKRDEVEFNHLRIQQVRASDRVIQFLIFFHKCLFFIYTADIV